MISGPDRQLYISLIEENVSIGGNRETACKILGINLSTYFRWKQQLKINGNTCDLRPLASHPEPANKLSPAERALVLNTLHSSEFADTSPNEIVAKLADQGTYIASERTFYRILKEENELHHRGRSKSPVKREPPSHVATAPNQVWSWDITYLNGPVKGHYFFLYMILDIFSRFIVGWEVWEEQSSEHAKTLVSKAALAEHIAPNSMLILHSDNGSPMKAFDMLTKLQHLGIQPSFSRPHVSNDNPFSESLFRICKYRPDFLVNGFPSLEEARRWCKSFVDWYNFRHYHSGIKFLTPHQRHHLDWQNISHKRTDVYEAAKAKHPERWNGRSTRNWQAPTEVSLNRTNQ